MSWIFAGIFLFFISCLSTLRTIFIFFHRALLFLLFVIDNVLSYIDTSDFKLFGGEYLVDMLVESAFCYLIFRKAVK